MPAGRKARGTLTAAAPISPSGHQGSEWQMIDFAWLALVAGLTAASLLYAGLLERT